VLPLPRKLLVALMLAGCGAPVRPTYGPQDLWLEPVRVFGRVLFADETAPVADALAEVLARPDYGGWHVEAPGKLRALWSEAQAGRLPGRSGVCEAAPPPALLGQALRPGASHAEADARCGMDDCTLTVVVYADAPRNEGRGEERGRFAAKLPANETPAQWAERLRGGALARVAPPSEDGTSVLGDLAGLALEPGLHVSLQGVTQSGDWAYDLDESRFQPRAQALRACAPRDGVWRDWWAQPFQIELSAEGHVIRCEAQHPDHLPPPGFACECDVMRGMFFGLGTPGRRAQFDLGVYEGGVRSTRDPLVRRAYVLVKDASDATASLGTRAVDEVALAACLGDVHDPLPEIEVPVRFEVDAEGAVRAHHADWPAALPAASTACLDQVLARGRFNCPLSGAASLDARLSLAVTRIAAAR
jgi:hypothetical protein